MAEQLYRVAHLGLGGRGTLHADTFLELSNRYTLVGLCELREDRLREYCQEKGLDHSICYTDAERMLAETKPDIFCFITQPDTPRSYFVELAAKYNVMAIALEKPIATSLPEASRIINICREHGIRGVVSHQQKYLTSLQKLKEVIEAGQIGQIHLTTASCRAWLAELGTHFVDYTLWVNGFNKADWVVGHVHGRELLHSNHPSPDYVMGQMGFNNGVRAFVEFGNLAPVRIRPDQLMRDNRLTVYGREGHVWAETDGRWGGLIGGQVYEEQGEDWPTQECNRLQPLYMQELADWLDGTVNDHSCNLVHAYQGYEIMQALCVSAMDNVRVDLPLDAGNMYDIFERMRQELPPCTERDHG